MVPLFDQGPNAMISRCYAAKMEEEHCSVTTASCKVSFPHDMISLTAFASRNDIIWRRV
jgi:hypothetical protein